MNHFSKHVQIINSKQSLETFDIIVVPGIGNFGQVMKTLIN